jgi:phenylalanyl-tRNA synthetase beta chain
MTDTTARRFQKDEGGITMLVPMKWLQDYVAVSIDTQELADRMTMSGSKVEEIREWGDKLDKLVIGRITAIVPHPNADKLVVASVDIGGGESLQIVTGATNIREGDTVPIALDGTELPNGSDNRRGRPARRNVSGDDVLS